MTERKVVFDCFPFFNEVELLEIRLAEMSRAVDVFVLAESPVTHQGNPKPLIFDDNRSRFRSYLSRIRHIVVEDMPGGEETWPRERFQRNALRRGLKDAPLDAQILVSDVDEIIRPRAVAAARQLGAFCFLAMPLHIYFLDRRHGRWMKAYSAPWAYIRDMEDLAEPRVREQDYLHKQGFDPKRQIIEDAGWHMSWMGGVGAMITKLQAFAHTEPEVARWQDEAALNASVQAERFFRTGRQLTKVPLADLPVLVRRRPAHYYASGMLRSRPGWNERLAALVSART